MPDVITQLGTYGDAIERSMAIDVPTLRVQPCAPAKRRYGRPFLVAAAATSLAVAGLVGVATFATFGTTDRPARVGTVAGVNAPAQPSASGPPTATVASFEMPRSTASHDNLPPLPEGWTYMDTGAGTPPVAVNQAEFAAKGQALSDRLAAENPGYVFFFGADVDGNPVATYKCKKDPTPPQERAGCEQLR